MALLQVQVLCCCTEAELSAECIEVAPHLIGCAVLVRYESGYTAAGSRATDGERSAAAAGPSKFPSWDAPNRRRQSPTVSVTERSAHYWFLAIARCGDTNEVWPIAGVEDEVQLSVVKNSTPAPQLTKQARRGEDL